MELQRHSKYKVEFDDGSGVRSGLAESCLSQYTEEAKKEGEKKAAALYGGEVTPSSSCDTPLQRSERRRTLILESGTIQKAFFSENFFKNCFKILYRLEVSDTEEGDFNRLIQLLNGNWADDHLISLLIDSEESLLRGDFLGEDGSMRGNAQTSKTSLYGGEVVQLTAEEITELNISWMRGRVSDNFYATANFVLLNEDEIMEEQNVDKKGLSPDLLQGNYIFAIRPLESRR